MSARLRPHAAPATLLSIAVALALAVAGVLTLSGAEAANKQPKCGDTITADTTLHHDLVNCPNIGIVIGADGITLDLNGHTIDSDGKPFPNCPKGELCDSGVVSEDHDGVTVKNGSVREFAFGLNLGPARHARVLNLSAVENGFIGIVCFKCFRSLVRDSSGSGSFAGEDALGMGLFRSHHDRIVHNSFRGNGHLGILVAGGRRRPSSNNSIKGNLFSRNGDEAILMEGGEGFRVSRNRFVRNGGGITLGPGSENVITRNRVSQGRDGIRVEKGHDNLVAHNVVVRTRQSGIRLGIRHPFLGGAHNVVRGNLVKDSREDGFSVNEKDHRSLLVRNIARGAGDDGFDIRSKTAKLTRNRALRNGDLGIQAVRGVNDGGGNVARHNGDPRQCTNIVCG